MFVYIRLKKALHHQHYDYVGVLESEPLGQRPLEGPAGCHLSQHHPALAAAAAPQWAASRSKMMTTMTQWWVIVVIIFGGPPLSTLVLQ